MFFYFWAQFKAPISIYFWHKQHCILFNLFDCTHRNEWFVIYCHRCYFVCSLLSESVENIFLFFSLYCHSNGFEMIINHICTYQKRNKKKETTKHHFGCRQKFDHRVPYHLRCYFFILLLFCELLFIQFLRIVFVCTVLLSMISYT